MRGAVTPRAAAWVALAAAAALLLAPAGPAGRAAANPRPPDVLDGARLKLALEKLQVTGSALYVAAHPDDENTACLAWLANGRKVRTGYLAMTRGGGGQNLVGPDLGVLLGVLRTQELLAARRVDGAEQFFTRALDFGYSKNPDETLAIWDHDRILADVVWVIRRFQPDVIVTRFPTDGRGGHGHHTASAILAEEAFTAAADPGRFPEQLAFVQPWRARRLVWNVFRFGSQGPDTTHGRVSVDLGGYDPLLGRSYTEIAGESRSFHKTQGFGSAERRGEYTNTFEARLGEPAAGDLFDGVDLTWRRELGAARLDELFARAAREFDADHPAAVVPLLMEARGLLAGLPADALVERKRAELDGVIRSCLGLWVEAVAAAPGASPGEHVRVVTSALNRSDVLVTLDGVQVVGGPSVTARRRLPDNVAVTDTLDLAVPVDAQPSQPYWLARPPLPGSFDVRDQLLIGRPESPPAFQARFLLSVAGRPLALDLPVVYRWTDRVQGERYRDFVVVPPVDLRFEQGVALFPDAAPRDLRLAVAAAERRLAGEVRLRLPDGWRSDPARVPVMLAAGAETTLVFRVTPGPGPAASSVTAECAVRGRTWSWRRVELDYPHLPLQSLLQPAEARLVRADLAHAGHRVGYLMGSGDDGPEALRQMGYQVTLLTDDQVEHADLAGYDAIVAGVRAYNTRPRLVALQPRLLGYVAAGGRLVVQYDTADRDLNDRLGPAPFSISRDRVTVEGAPVTLVLPDHPLLTEPNRITAADFEGWVQERGTYFANPFDASYQAPLASHDPGEEPLRGGLLYARWGKGVFVYTGYAFFRQLPAGVPGAWRLFANLVSPARAAP